MDKPYEKEAGDSGCGAGGFGGYAGAGGPGLYADAYRERWTFSFERQDEGEGAGAFTA